MVAFVNIYYTVALPFVEIGMSESLITLIK